MFLHWSVLFMCCSWLLCIVRDCYALFVIAMHCSWLLCIARDCYALLTTYSCLYGAHCLLCVVYICMLLIAHYVSLMFCMLLISQYGLLMFAICLLIFVWCLCVFHIFCCLPLTCAMCGSLLVHVWLCLYISHCSSCVAHVCYTYVSCLLYICCSLLIMCCSCLLYVCLMFAIRMLFTARYVLLMFVNCSLLIMCGACWCIVQGLLCVARDCTHVC